MLRLTPVVELFAHARADLLADLGGIDRRVEAAADGKQPFELLQVGLDRRLHVRILKLAGERLPAQGAGAMHLAQRSGRGGAVLEVLEFLFPIGAEFRVHAALDEGPAHGRGFALQLLQFGGVFRRQQIRDGRHELGDLHQRPFETAERGGERRRLPSAIRTGAEKPGAGKARRHAAHSRANPRIARGAGGEAVLFAVRSLPDLPSRFGQLSRIQRARLSSLTSPAASDMMILVA